jgi:predicted metal-dependent hydrolase
MEDIAKEFGPVRIVRTRRARHIKITVRPFAGVRVSYPYYCSKKDAIDYLFTKRAWVLKNIAAMQHYEQMQLAANAALPPVDITEAKRVITERVYELAQGTTFFFTGISIRSQKTLWGSCSARNRLSLNKYLVMLPDILRDYVIFHELVHTQIKDHSKRFWHELEKYVPEAKSRDKELRRYHLHLY